MNIDPARLSARNQNRSTVVSQKGMVCTSHPLATMAGIDTLKEGGNAIDAAPIIETKIKLSIAATVCSPFAYKLPIQGKKLNPMIPGIHHINIIVGTYGNPRRTAELSVTVTLRTPCGNKLPI